MTLTFKVDIDSNQGEKDCQIFRSEVTLLKSFCVNTQPDIGYTHNGPITLLGQLKRSVIISGYVSRLDIVRT